MLAADAAGLDAQFLALFGADLDIMSMDFFGLSAALYDDALNNAGAVYGITNVTTPCIAPGASGQYFFGDASDINCSVSAFSDPPASFGRHRSVNRSIGPCSCGARAGLAPISCPCGRPDGIYVPQRQECARPGRRIANGRCRTFQRAAVSQFLTAIYAEYFGGGIGFLMMAPLTMAGVVKSASAATPGTRHSK